MKYIIGVIINDDNDVYRDMKNIWINNMLIYNVTDMELYFIYGKNNNGIIIERVVNNVYNFYGNYEETFDNILKKTLDFMEFINKKYDEYMLIRTNASTLFNLPLLKHYMNNVSLFKSFASGTITSARYDFPDGTHHDMLLFSGTNLCISKDIVGKCIDARKLIELYGSSGLLEDVALSKYILYNMKCEKKNTMSRVDILNIMELHHCQNAFNVCCFRFKSSDRKVDVSRMQELLYSDFDVKLLLKWENELGVYLKIPKTQA